MPRETWVYIALLYLARGITNSEGLALSNNQLCFINYENNTKKKNPSFNIENDDFKKIVGLPWVVKYSKGAVIRSSMSSSSKNPNMHAITG